MIGEQNGIEKIIQLEGMAVVETEAGRINKGKESVSFNAYIKVTSVVGGKDGLVAMVNFSDGAYILEKNYNIPVSVANEAKNFIAQAYEHLKTLPEFAGATDC